MIRKVTMAAFALAALGLAPGCENQGQRAQHKEKQATSQAQKESAKAQKEYAKAEKESAEAQQKQQEAHRLEQQQPAATGGSGAAAGAAAGTEAGAAQTATGSVTKASPNELTLKPQAGGEPLQLSVDQNTRVMRDGQASSLDTIREGDEVRASYQQKGGQNVATEVTVEKSGTGGSGMQDGGAVDGAKQQGSEAWEGAKGGAKKLEQDVGQ